MCILPLRGLLTPHLFGAIIFAMHWVYIIKSKKNGELYIGNTGNLIQRLKEHNLGRSRATARYRPWFYVYIEGYFSEDDAVNREHNLKYFGKVYAQLKRRIKNSLQGAEKVRG